MLASLETLTTVQGRDALRTPERLARAPVRTAGLEGLRRRNSALDALFYDVANITPDEAARLVPWLAAEGAILVVPPSGHGVVEVFPTIEAFAARAGSAVTTLTIAGVGSSALGGAALARNVADATGVPVAAVVSGYGVSDLVAEALGGWFWFGTVNRMRHAFEVAPAAGSIEAGSASLDRLTDRYASRDSIITAALLSDPRFGFQLLVGHSKGNLVLSEALFAAARALDGQGRSLPDGLLVVTLGAVITMPAACRNVVDIMGEWDTLGRLNSNPAIPVDVTVPRAGHHTNTEIPGHVPVRSVLRDVLSRKPGAPRPQLTPLP